MTLRDLKRFSLSLTLLISTRFLFILTFTLKQHILFATNYSIYSVIFTLIYLFSALLSLSACTNFKCAFIVITFLTCT